MITVDYKGKTLAALAPGKKAILKCANMMMEDNVVITAPESTGGGGECSGKHIIELEELPQNGLVEGEVYKVKKKALLSVAIYTEDLIAPDSIGLLIAILGPMFGIEDGTIPDGVYRYSKEVPTDVPEFELSFCYVESENMLYAYNIDLGAWISVAEAQDSDMPYIGAITSMDQITEYGMYALLGYEGSKFYEIEPESYKMIGLMNGVPTDISTLLPITLVSVPTKPTENIIESTDKSYYCYYIEDEGDVFLYQGGEWSLFSNAMGAEFGGFIETMGQATDENAFYILTNKGGLVDYFHPEGTMKIIESGNYDVTKISAVKVNVPDHAIYGKRRLTFKSMPKTGLTVQVNFTTTYQGETVNCRAISFEYDFMDDGVNIDYVTTDGSRIRLYAEGLGEGYMSEGVSSYVDFGPEPQLVTKEFADYIMQGPALFEVVATPNITFTVDDIEYSALPEITWHEFCAQTEGFNSYMYWGGNPTKDEKYIYYNSKRVESMSTIINGAAYTTA